MYNMQDFLVKLAAAKSAMAELNLVMCEIQECGNDVFADFANELYPQDQDALQDLMDSATFYYDMARDLLNIAYISDYDGQPDEAQEWHDFDPDC